MNRKKVVLRFFAWKFLKGMSLQLNWLNYISNRTIYSSGSWKHYRERNIIIHLIRLLKDKKEKRKKRILFLYTNSVLLFKVIDIDDFNNIFEDIQNWIAKIKNVAVLLLDPSFKRYTYVFFKDCFQYGVERSAK